MKNITDEKLEQLLKHTANESFRPFFGARVLNRLNKTKAIPLIGNIVVSRYWLRGSIYAGAACILLLLGISFYQDGSISIDHLLGLGNFTEEDILDYIQPLI